MFFILVAINNERGSLESQIAAVTEEYQQGKVPCAHCMPQLCLLLFLLQTNKGYRKRLS